MIHKNKSIARLLQKVRLKLQREQSYDKNKDIPIVVGR